MPLWRSATLALALSACGDQAMPPDAAVPSDAAGEGLVAVHLITDPAARAARPVYFLGPDGAVVLATRTNADGRANAYMPAGGSVTVVDDAGLLRLWTYTGVAAGDQLELDLHQGTSLIAEIQLSFSAAPSAQSYQLQTSCGPAAVFDPTIGAAPVAIPACDSEADLLLLARNGNGALIGALGANGASLAPGTTVDLGGSYRPPTMSLVRARNIPPSALQLVATHGTLGRVDLLYSQALAFTLATPDEQLEFTIPTGDAGTIIQLLDASATIASQADWRDANLPADFDLSAVLPRPNAEPVFDPATRTFSVTETPGTVAADAVLLRFVTIDAQWDILAPAGSSVHVPVLPDDRLDALGDAIPVWWIAAAATGGYPSIRSRVLGRLPERDWPMAEHAGHAIYEMTSF